MHIQHIATLALLGGVPVHAPVKDPKKTIDIGCCVNADMTLYLAKKFPNAQVYGLDLSEVRLENIPKNVSFICGNALKLIGVDPRLEEGTFDYVYSRYLCAGVDDWPAHIAKTTTLVAPGGWLEMLDAFSFVMRKYGQPIPKEKEWYQYVFHSRTWPQNDPFAVDCFKDLLQENGLKDVDGKPVPAPWEPPPLPDYPEGEL